MYEMLADSHSWDKETFSLRRLVIGKLGVIGHFECARRRMMRSEAQKFFEAFNEGLKQNRPSYPRKRVMFVVPASAGVLVQPIPLERKANLER